MPPTPGKTDGVAGGPTTNHRERGTTRSPGLRVAPDGAARPGARRRQDINTLDNLDEPFVNDLDEVDSPPIPGKVHPSAEISDAVPTLDDEVRHFRHHPNEAGSIEFDVDPYAADAAADLAGELGSEFLEGATRGQDMSDIHMAHEDMETDTAFLYEDALLDSDDTEAEDLADGLPVDAEIESERRPLDRQMQDAPRAGTTHLRNVAGKK